ncbi:hypothetical protein [Fimbriiglobus ruber]|uniref:Glycosyltransferase RgtA/B/C/D-like domain-containing protein n=1 Tax=Fimbriiglobus ruber TaxID=1908690 RepID=A0A225DRX7_9BACT|nr:hypothetical protein [Fimbriiglobus ruber]OWK39135.1 hypothetical protein FRUB_06217 [Fimbriiglobus ruber]
MAGRVCRAFARPDTLFFLTVWAAFLVIFRERGFYDPGSLWHIKVGDWILDRGFPWTDPFTYTFAGHTWIPQQWGAEVLMALAHRAGGFDTMLLGFCTLVAGLYAWVFARMRQAGMSWALAGVFTSAGLFAGAFHYFVRPHMFTIAFMGWTMACLVDFDRGRATLWRLLGLVPLYVLWTNLHGGVLGGDMMLGLAVAGWGAVFLWQQLRKGTTTVPEGETPPAEVSPNPVRSWRTLVVLMAIVGACGLAPFANPFGMEMLNTWKRIVGSEVLKNVVNEHKPLNLTSAADQVIFGFGVGYLILFAGTFPQRPRVTWLIPLVWFALTFRGIRQGPLFAVTAVVVFADFWPHTVWCRLLKKYGDSLVQDPPDPTAALSWRGLVVPVLAVLAVFGLQASDTHVPVVGRGWAQIDSGYAPLELTDTLHAYARAAGPNARLFNDANLGGYLIYHVPEMKIFMDDRFELYGDAWTAEYVDMIWYHPEYLDNYLTRYDLDLALVVTNDREPSTLDAYLASCKGWREIGRTKCAALYRRDRGQ